VDSLRIQQAMAAEPASRGVYRFGLFVAQGAESPDFAACERDFQALPCFGVHGRHGRRRRGDENRSHRQQTGVD